MKRRLLNVAVVVAFVLSLCTPTMAAPEDSGAAIMADVVIARPLCLAATAIGSVFFVLALPVSVPTKSVNRTAHALVVTPAKATFTRALGDFEDLKE